MQARCQEINRQIENARILNSVVKMKTDLLHIVQSQNFNEKQEEFISM